MSQQSYAQILKDKGKLKTSKSDAKGFVIFGRKIKTQSDKSKPVKKSPSSARFSSNRNIGRKKKVSPGFSTPLFGSRIKSVSPRFSKKRFVSSNSFSGANFSPGKKRVKRGTVSPKTSPVSRGAVQLAGGPRYSAKPKRGKKYGVQPRFSPHKGGAIQLAEGPRYSAKTKRGKKYGVQPRYSAHRGGAIELAEGPRYSAKPRRGKKNGVQPRFSAQRDGAIKLSEAPRYSNSPKRGKKLQVLPRYSAKNREGVIQPYPVRYSTPVKLGNKQRVSPLFSDLGKRNTKVIKKPGFTVFDYLLAIPGGVLLIVKPYDEELALYKGWLKKKEVDKKQNGNSDFQGHSNTKIKLFRDLRDKRRARNLLTYNGDFKRKTAFFRKMEDNNRSSKQSGFIVEARLRKRKKHMHPSAVNLTVKRRSTKTGKAITKKTSKFLTKVDGNKVQPPTVRGRSKKVKFDKKEKDLWYE